MRVRGKRCKGGRVRNGREESDLHTPGRCTAEVDAGLQFSLSAQSADALKHVHRGNRENDRFGLS